MVFATATVAVALLASGGGCELAVGDTVPDFACEPNTPDNCPPNTVCDPHRDQCVQSCTVGGCLGGMQCDVNSHLCADASVQPMTDAAGIDQEVDAWFLDSGSPAPEAAVDTSVADTSTVEEATVPDAPGGDSGSCTGLMCKCVGNIACDSHICADQLTVGSGLYAAAGGANFCTKPCCTSADCDANTVCYATATGGSYCVLPAWLGRSAQVGAALGGASCSANGNCRSGLCANNSCADTCCSTARSSAECGNGTSCSFGTFPGVPTFDQGFIAYCGQGGTGQNGAMCNFGDECESTLCYRSSCQNACRNTPDCGGLGYTCGYYRDSMNNATIYAVCAPTRNNSAPQGSDCTSDSDCASDFCDPTSSKCTDVCFADADCTASGWRCRPEQIMLQSGGSASVLCCGP
jgi:hypothetical protein